ncbi:hypothetical protein [Formosa haliotis]|uniref:hypothetical protein n=1 Tax=Formosa haliotis TaxID=1555194 RepID=UPI00082478B4|nr:hypothetical protein [Formosa haliotis]
MKKILLILTVLFCFQVSAQQAELDAFKDLFNSEKKTVLGEFMELDANQSMTFWEIYDAYTAERETISNRKLELLKTYVDEYSSVTDEQADAIVKETFSIRAKNEKIQKKYYKKVKKALGAKKASQFLQFERYVQTSIDADLQEALPLIGEK